MISGIPRYVSILPQQPPVYSHCPLSCLSLSTTQLHFGMRGRTMAVRGKTKPPPTPHPSTPHPAAGFQFHAMRERQPGVQSSCEESMRVFPFLAEDSRSVQEWCKAHQCHGHIYLWLIHQLENLKKKSAFIFLLHVWSAETTAQSLRQHTNPPFICLCWHQAYDPLPPKNPRHPKRKAIFQGNWVNQQWNQDELIIPSKLFVSHI